MPSVKSLIRRRQFKKSIPSILIFLSIVIIILSVYYVLSRQKQGQQEIQTCPECPQTLAPEERTPCPTNQDQMFSISNVLTILYIIATIGLAACFVLSKRDNFKDSGYFKFVYGLCWLLLLIMYILLLVTITEQTDLSAMIGITGILYILILPVNMFF